MRYAITSKVPGDVSATTSTATSPAVVSSPLNPEIAVPTAFVVGLIAAKFELNLGISTSTVKLWDLTITATVKVAGGVYSRLEVASAQLQPAPPIPGPFVPGSTPGPPYVDQWTGGAILSLPVEMDPTDDYIVDVNCAGLASGDGLTLFASQSTVLLYGTADTDNT